MARNDGVDRTLVRHKKYTRVTVKKAQTHNEREKEAYLNQDIIPERSYLNVYFKKPNGKYIDIFDDMEKEKIISTRGLKEDANIFGELVFDVNTAYYHKNGGYEYAKKYLEESYKAAVEIVGGEQYIVSAVMHADERNRGLSSELEEDVYHYHLHVVYIPVVEKEILWSKRCKDKALIGTVKETIMQVSSSKKWESKPVLDEKGQPILNASGKPILRLSYSVLQDDYYNHMRNAGYDDVQRGEKGSSEEHLTITQFKVEKEKERLNKLLEKEKEVQKSIEEAENTLEEVEIALDEAEEKLDEMAYAVEDIGDLMKKYDDPVEEILPEPSTFETVRNYREKKVIPLFKKLLDDMCSIKRAYHELLSSAVKIKNNYDYAVKTNKSLIKRNKELVQENSLLKEKADAFNYVLKGLGSEKVRDIVERVKEREKEKERERAWKRNQMSR